MAIVADSFGQLQNFRFQLPQIEQRQYLSALEQRRAEEDARNRRMAALWEAEAANRDRMQQAANLFGQAQAADIRDIRGERFKSAVTAREQKLREAELAAGMEAIKENRLMQNEEIRRRRFAELMDAAQRVTDPAILKNLFPDATPAEISAALSSFGEFQQERDVRAAHAQGIADIFNKPADLQKLARSIFQGPGYGEPAPKYMENLDRVAAELGSTRYGVPDSTRNMEPKFSVLRYLAGLLGGPTTGYGATTAYVPTESQPEYLDRLRQAFTEEEKRAQTEAAAAARDRSLMGLVGSEGGRYVPLYRNRSAPPPALTAPPAQAATARKTLTPELAKQFVVLAGGDKDKARAMAAAAGYSF